MATDRERAPSPGIDPAPDARTTTDLLGELDDPQAEVEATSAPRVSPALLGTLRGEVPGGVRGFGDSRASALLGLQRTVGNRVVQRLAQRAAAPAPPAPPRAAIITGSEVVTPTLHPPAAASRPPAYSTPAPAAPAGPTARTTGTELPARSAEEGQETAMAPVDTEDEKVNYLTASTPTSNDITPSGSSGLTRIRLSDVEIRGEAYDDGGQWKIRVTAASTAIHWGINTSGYQIPNPVDGGNITQANWQTVVQELQGYQARQAAGSWHHPDATRTHELNHVAWFQGEIVRTWPAIETAIQSHALGATASMTQVQAQADMQTFLDQKRRDWFNAYGVAPEPPAYAAGQAVLNGIIATIESYARSKGWNP